MPMKPSVYCSAPNCSERVPAGRCAKHARELDRRRGSAFERGYDRRWQRARRRFLSKPENFLCIDCKSEGFIEAATVVDHIRPHRGDEGLFWDETNWAPRCKPHHDAKTGRGL
jgi:5-methylcytosine-specific restriction enzyme A